VSACSICNGRWKCSRRSRACSAPVGAFAVSYSNRCFPTKAVAIWRALDMAGQAKLIALYLERAGFAAIETQVLADGARSDPLVVVTGRTTG
jgi:hypothetical protein